MSTYEQALSSARAYAQSAVSETKSAIETLGRLSDELRSAAGPEAPRRRFFSDHDQNEFLSAADKLGKNIARTVRAGSKGKQRQQALSIELFDHSYMARLCGVIRAAVRRGKYRSPGQLRRDAGRLRVDVPLSEKGTAYWKRKFEGGARLIVRDELLRTAQRLLVRDRLSALQDGTNLDCSRQGGGGERQLIKNVCVNIGEGNQHLWMPDVKSFFPSLKPGHFKGFPIPARTLLNVAFLPKCAKIRVRYRKEDKAAIAKALRHAFPDHIGDTLSHKDIVRFTTQLVRQGLNQGSALSPLLARGFLGRELRKALGKHNVFLRCYADNLALGALSEEEAKAARQVVIDHFRSHPAGPIEFHDPGIQSPNEVDLLGYVLRPGEGFEGNPVHVKPGKKRIDRHKARLAKRLLAAENQSEDLYGAAARYWRTWFDSMQAWTKVPRQSADVSEAITMSYVDDFKLGIPMGSGWVTQKFSDPTSLGENS